ncbi:MAG TPA: hypothetical protein VK254_03040 [Candidatus Bathyarchaeia archaeon]|nr:hypothetical protein [Candidatus Bathyarchaeia archaeon]
MTSEQIKKAMDEYRQFFEKHGIEKIDYPKDRRLSNPEMGLSHCHGMLDKMEEFLKEDRREKAMRWLCFIQCSPWSNGYYTIGQLADHNRGE